MKVCFLGDTHFGCRGDSQHFHNFFDTFYTDTFFPYLIKNKIKTVVQLGDIFDRRKYSNHFSLAEAQRYFFSKFEEFDIQLVTLLGNHDLYFKESLSVSSSELFLTQFKNVRVIKEPTQLQLDISIDIIPWICKENYAETVTFIKNSTSTMCVGHFEITGFKMYKNGISAEDGLSDKLFSNYERVLSGHYHHRSSRGNIEYIGTPYEMTWQDYGDQKGFHILDCSTRKMSFIKNPYSIYHKIEYDDSGKSDVTTSSYLDKDFLENFKSKYIKVQIVNKTNPYLFDLFLDQIYAQNPLDVSIIEDIIDVAIEDSVDETDDTLTITFKYIDSVGQIDLDKSKLKSMMSSLYNEAMAIE
jgi:DNA repair exonuclease SbcCD nuclease subunit